jgi:hypothetical protein
MFYLNQNIPANYRQVIGKLQAIYRRINTCYPNAYPLLKRGIPSNYSIPG